MDINELKENYFSLFITDARDYLSQIVESLMVLENEMTNKDMIDSIFRAFHSIKGASGILEYHNLEKLTHISENLLSDVREGKISINDEIMDMLFKVLDYLEKGIEKIEKSGDDIDFENDLGIKFSVIEDKINKILNKKVISSKNVNTKKRVVGNVINEPEIIKEIKDKGYKIQIILKEDAMMKNVRLFLIYQNLSSIGDIIYSLPDIKKLEDEENEIEYEKSIVYIDSETDVDTIKKLALVSDVKEATVEELKRIEDLDLENEIKKDDLKESDNKVKTELKKNNAEKPKVIKEEKTKKAESKKVEANEKLNKKVKVKEYLKVEREKLDSLLNVVGELVIDKSRYNQMRIELKKLYMELIEKGIDKKELKKLFNFIDELKKLNKHLERESIELQKEVTELRMVPIKELFLRFPRAIKELGKRLNKEVEFEIHGEDTELDKIIVERLSDPLLHMIRNSMDHGIEMPEIRSKTGKNKKGIIKLSALNEGNDIIIKIEDDGAGIDSEKIVKKCIEKGIITEAKAKNLTKLEKLNLIFLPGFSTADSLSDVSGRGVGMDVVKRSIEMLKGRVEIDTEVGKGTTFIVHLPLTLAIINALLVQNNGNIYSFALDNVVTTVKVKKEDIEDVNGNRVSKLREQVVPIFSLDEIFNNKIDEEKTKKEKNIIDVILVKRGNSIYGFEVDSLLGQQEIVIKNIEGEYHKDKGISGAAVLGDGKIAIMVDLENLIEYYSARQA
ncbi:chemotaxis protein CheA [Haliovirga abyssi]|uniref:Chemotaxis protein CheA n=1 Tax=Haliovirga abyssi TaxID=2996794 RepID=A0AAU9DET1_9FUSO|nr:chemotaxis protein CheA [Haliovirga abyssi]BDU50882.1 chemotaxis protein CheA [Haliovirga abyssi]